jgi:hypothetical protein
MVIDALLEMRDTKFDKILKFDSLKGKSYSFGHYIAQFMHAYGLRPMNENKKPDGTSFGKLPEPFQNFGLRTSYTEYDDIAVALLKFIFYPMFAGYIAPELIQIKGKFHHEMCLFNPKECILTSGKNDSSQAVEVTTLLLNALQQNGGENTMKITGTHFQLKSRDLSIEQARPSKPSTPNEKKSQSQSQLTRTQVNPSNISDKPELEENNNYNSDDSSSVQYYLEFFSNEKIFRELSKRVRTQLMYMD